MHYIYASGNTNDDDYFAEIMSAVDPAIGKEAMTLQQIHEQRGEQGGIPNGIQIGEERVTISIVKKMLAIGEPVEKEAYFVVYLLKKFINCCKCKLKAWLN